METGTVQQSDINILPTAVLNDLVGNTYFAKPKTVHEFYPKEACGPSSLHDTLPDEPLIEDLYPGIENWSSGTFPFGNSLDSTYLNNGKPALVGGLSNLDD